MRKNLLLSLVPAVIIMCSSCGGGDDSEAPSSRAYDCSVFPPASTSPYVLPWPVGTTREANPHAARRLDGPATTAQEWSLDVEMPIGSDIVAMRAGTVVNLRENYFDGDNSVGHENYMTVLHDDGTMARYVHLTNNGALLEVGTLARQGALIARSGHTGNSTAPHLHFDVIAANDVPADYSNIYTSKTIPLNFRNATASNGTMSCGLQKGVFYTAEEPR